MASETTNMAVGGIIHLDTKVVEVAEFNFDVRCDLRGCMEAAIASEAINMDVGGNMHMDTRVIKVAGFKSEVKLGF